VGTAGGCRKPSELAPPFLTGTRQARMAWEISSSTCLCPTTIDYEWIELVTGTARGRRWSAGRRNRSFEASDHRIIEASYAPGESVSSVARRHGAAPNLLYRQRRLMTEGGGTAVGSAIG
jgi:Transposase